jgi:hypothetical protein
VIFVIRCGKTVCYTRHTMCESIRYALMPITIYICIYLNLYCIEHVSRLNTPSHAARCSTNTNRALRENGKCWYDSYGSKQNVLTSVHNWKQNHYFMPFKKRLTMSFLRIKVPEMTSHPFFVRIRSWNRPVTLCTALFNAPEIQILPDTAAFGR